MIAIYEYVCDHPGPVFLVALTYLATWCLSWVMSEAAAKRAKKKARTCKLAIGSTVWWVEKTFPSDAKEKTLTLVYRSGRVVSEDGDKVCLEVLQNTKQQIQFVERRFVAKDRSEAAEIYSLPFPRLLAADRWDWGWGPQYDGGNG
jgi:hypothetical protein